MSNPNHDPSNGQFTSGPGGKASGNGIKVNRHPHRLEMLNRLNHMTGGKPPTAFQVKAAVDATLKAQGLDQKSLDAKRAAEHAAWSARNDLTNPNSEASRAWAAKVNARGATVHPLVQSLQKSAAMHSGDPAFAQKGLAKYKSQLNKAGFKQVSKTGFTHFTRKAGLKFEK